MSAAADFTPGAIITRDNPLWDGYCPSWLRDDATIETSWYSGRWHVCPEKLARDFDGVWDEVVAIRLDASDIVYQCIRWNEAHPDEPPMWPWYGGDAAPADYSGHVLFGNGVVSAGKDDAVENPWSWVQPYPPEGTSLIIGYQRRPTPSLPEPAEEEQREWFPHRDFTGDEMRVNCFREPYPMQEEIERLKAACERAGGVFVPFMTESEVRAIHMEWLEVPYAGPMATYFTKRFGIIRPDPTPLDIAKAEYPEIPAEKIERIAAIVKGEAR